MTRAPYLVVVAILVAATAPSSAQPAAATVSYRFTYAQPDDATAVVEIGWSTANPERRTLIMPRAIPMGYGEQRYDAFVKDLRAWSAEGAETSPQRDEGPRWRLGPNTVRVRYRVDLREMEREVRAASDASRVRDGYLGALGYSVFAYVEGDETRPTHLRLEGPAGWPVYSTLAPRWPVTSTSIDATAPDYYALADSQIVMGPRAVFRRLSEKPAPLYLASYAEGPVDLDGVGRLALTAYERVLAYFGTVPFAHYSVHQELLTPISPRHEYGMSMEHLDSSTYYLAASSGLTSSSTEQDELRVLYNFAHHIAHSWVPKRVYGHGYFPFQWELAPVIDSIWFAEGFGQYAALMAIAAGMPDPAAYRQDMLTRRFRSNVTGAPDFLKRLPLVDLSRIASTRYAEDFRTGRLVFSRGGLMAAAIDDRIQAASNGARSLRDGFRFLVSWSAQERRAIGTGELASLIQRATGVDVQPVIDEWLRPSP